MKKISIVLWLCMACTCAVQAQNPLLVTGPSGPTGAPTGAQHVQESTDGRISVGIDTTVVAPDAAFVVGNQNYSGSIPVILSSIINFIPNTGGLQPGYSDFSSVILRTPYIGHDPVVDMAVDNNGLVGIGNVPAAFGSYGAHLAVTDPDASGTIDLVSVITNQNIQSLMITAAGNVGIGTATPSAQLHISNTAFDDAPNVLTCIDNTSYLVTSGSGGHGSIVSYDQYAAYALMVRRVHTERESGGFPSSPTTIYDMVVDSNGHVGVGTSSPSTILDVFGPDSTTSLLKVASSSGTAMYITHSGKVGIGTTTPSQALQVSGTAVATHLQMTSGAANGYILKSDSDGNGSWVDPATVGGLWVASGTDIHNTNSGVVKTGGDLRVGTVSHTGLLEIDATSQGAYAYSNLVKGTDDNLKAIAVQKVVSGTGVDKFVVFGNGKTVTTDLQVTDGGAAGYVMQSDASGNASWVDPVSIGGNLWAASGSDIHNTNSGAVVIGGMAPATSTYNSYKLAVNGTLVSKKVMVETSDWADRVFDKSYELKPLTDVEEYINQNHHLPEIPIECDAIEKGVDVGEMNKLLLQKVEELTLYVIRLDKKNQELESKILSIK